MFDLAASIKKSEGIAETEADQPKKKRKKKQPNPLSCKKKKKKSPTSESAMHAIKNGGGIEKKPRKRIKVPTHVKKILHTKEA